MKRISRALLVIACTVAAVLATPAIAAATDVTTLPPLLDGDQATLRGEVSDDCAFSQGYFLLTDLTNGGPPQDSMFDLGHPDQFIPGGSGQYAEGPFGLQEDHEYTVQAVAGSTCSGGFTRGNIVFFRLGFGPQNPADVSITQTLEGTAKVGKPAVLVVTATNAGKNSATDAFIKVTMPAGFAYNACEATVGTVKLGFCWWDGEHMVVDDIGLFDAGAVATLRINVTPTVAGKFVNTVGVGAHEWDPDSANNFMDMPITVAP
jgi:hypothetical protein